MRENDVPNPSPEYFGYDVDKVPGVKCLGCDEPIGDGEYREVRAFARFGGMSFACLRCWLRWHPADGQLELF